jgi:hypothetical protein
MQLRYDEDFVEAAALVCSSGRRPGIAPLQIVRFQRERERLYSILDPYERNTAFCRLHLDWFREWSLEKLLTDVLQEFALLPGLLKTLVFRKARGKRDEGAELYVNEAGDRTGVVSMRPEHLEEEHRVTVYLRHELSHLQDMVDPAFGYAPELAVPQASVSQQRLARERYTVLWDTSIDGRLTGSGRPTIANQQRRWIEFTNTFGFWPAGEQERVFNSIWNDPAPNHQALEALVCDPRQVHSSAGPQPGGLCPLCGFPTFAWAAPAALGETVCAAIGREFPHWSPEQGSCGRCLEVFRCQQLAERVPV